MLASLRERVLPSMSAKRFRHTVAVEDMAARLASLYCPEHTNRLRAAALLHDLTKELSLDEQISLCDELGISVTDFDRLSPKTLHARTAAAKILLEYEDFSDPMIVDAVRWHTTGRADMTLAEKLLYLADYIDLSRTFENCVILRRYFFGADPEKLDITGREVLLRDTLLLSFDMTIRDLLSEGALIAPDTVNARDALLLEKKRTDA